MKVRPPVFGIDDPFTIDVMENLAGACEHQGKREQAIRLYEALLKRYRERHGNQHRKTLSTMVFLGRNLLAVNKFAETESTIHALLNTEELVAKHPWPESVALLSILGDSLVNQEKFSEAKDVFTAVYHLPGKSRGKLKRTISIILRQIKLSKALNDESGQRKWQSELVSLLLSLTPHIQIPG